MHHLYLRLLAWLGWLLYRTGERLMCAGGEHAWFYVEGGHLEKGQRCKRPHCMARRGLERKVG